MIDLVVAFVLFIFMPVLLCFSVATVSRRIKIYITTTYSTITASFQAFQKIPVEGRLDGASLRAGLTLMIYWAGRHG